MDKKILGVILAVALLATCQTVLAATNWFETAKEKAEQMAVDIRSEQVLQEAVVEARRMHFEKAKELLNKAEPSPQNTTLYLFCEEWESKLNSMSWGIKDNASPFWAKEGYGTLFEIEDAFFFIPDHVNEGTKYLVYFPGGVGIWTIRDDLVEAYLERFEPNAICVFFKESFIADIAKGQERLAIILKGLSKETKMAPQKIAIIGSSNGGYISLWAATYLFDNYNILTDKIVILDMGMGWSKDELIDADSAISLAEAGTTVYHFGRGHEINRAEGAVKFAGYGVKLVNVMCQHGGHDAISENAFLNGTFSWSVGLQDDIDPQEYTMERVNF